MTNDEITKFLDLASAQIGAILGDSSASRPAVRAVLLRVWKAGVLQGVIQTQDLRWAELMEVCTPSKN